MLYHGQEPCVINAIGKGANPEPELTLYYAGKQVCEPGHSHFGVRDHYLIHLVLSGTGRFRLDNTEYELRRAAGFTLLPGVPASYEADARDPWTYCWIGFSGSLAGAHLSRLGIDRRNPVFSFSNMEEIEACVLELAGLVNGSGRRWNPSVHAEFQARSLLYRLMHLLSQEKSKLENPKNGNMDRSAGRVFHAIRYLQNNHSRPVGMDEVASYLGISRKHLSDLFKTATGKSPKEYLCSYRLSVAAGLLAETDLPIKAVAHSTGFLDEFYFSRAFRSQYRATPSAYRNALARKTS